MSQTSLLNTENVPCFPPIVSGLFKVVAILTVFGIVSMIIFAISGRQYVMEHWDQYMCNPLIVPMAEFFGRNSIQMQEKCQTKNFRKAHALSLPPFLNIMGTMSFSLKESGNMMSQMDYMLEGVQNVFANSFTYLMKQVSSVIATVEYLVVKMETLLQRLGAALVVVMFTLNASLQGILAIRRDRDLQKSIDTIISFPSF